jgi:hypothetical protein
MTVQLYLDREFPHQVQGTWWDQNKMAQIFEISDGAVLRHIVVDLGFFQHCPDFILNCVTVSLWTIYASLDPPVGASA